MKQPFAVIGRRPVGGAMVGRNARWRVADLPTTKVGVERVFTYFIAGVRLGTVAQMVPAVRVGLATAPHHAVYLACWLAAAFASVAVTVVTLIRRRPVGSGVAAADFALACVLLVVAPYVVPPAARFGTWGAFEPGYALSVIITASGVRSLVLWAAGTVGIVLCYVVYLGDVAAGMVTTAMGNELTFVVYAVVARMLFNYIRRIAHDADVSRARVAELARQDEERRARVVMHNGVALMQLLAHSGPAVSQSGLADLAEAELVTRVCERFADLRVEPLLDLGAAVRVPADEAAAVERAVESLLLNVRAYAKAENVVIHLDQHGADGWSLTVSDDGVGFDPSVVVPGVGLREVVVGELRRRGLGVMITSAPGEGTTVTIDRDAR